MTVMLALFGVVDVLGGLRADPAIAVGVIALTPDQLQAASLEGYRLADFGARTQGLVLLGFGLVLTAIVAVPYRRRERWAWAVMWTLPGWATLVAAAYLVVGVRPDVPPPPPMVSGPIIALIAAAILFLERRTFARREEGFAGTPNEGLAVTGP